MLGTIVATSRLPCFPQHLSLRYVIVQLDYGDGGRKPAITAEAIRKLSTCEDPPTQQHE